MGEGILFTKEALKIWPVRDNINDGKEGKMMILTMEGMVTDLKTILDIIN